MKFEVKLPRGILFSFFLFVESLIANSLTAQDKPLPLHVRKVLSHSENKTTFEADRVQSLLTKYQTEKKKLTDSSELGVLKTIGIGTEVSFVILAGITTGGGSIVVGLTGLALQEAFSDTISDIEKAENLKSQALMLNLFSKLPRQVDESRSAADLFETLLVNSPHVNNEFLKLEGHEKSAFTQSMVNQMGKALKEFGSYQAYQNALNANASELQSHKIEGLTTRLAKTKGRLNNFIEKTNANVASLAANQQALTEEVGAMKDRLSTVELGTKENTEDIRFLQNVMFGKMSPAEQRVALTKRGFAEHLSSEQKMALDQKLRILDLQEKISRTTSKFLDSAQDVFFIARGLGLPPRELAKIQKVSQIVQAGSKAVNSLLSGNLLGAAGAIFSLFGGGPDIAEKRHQEIMAGMSQILEGQEKILIGLDQIYSGIIQVMKSQQTMFETLQKISEQMAAYHEEEMSELRALRFSSLVISDKITALLMEKIDQCLVFEQTRVFYNIEGSGFKAYEDLQKHFSDNAPSFHTCMTEGLEPLFFIKRLNGDSHPLLLRRSYEGVDSWVYKEIETAHKPMIELVSLLKKENPQIPLMSLGIPMLSQKNLEAKLLGLSKIEALSFNPGLRTLGITDDAEWMTYYRNTLSPNHLIGFTDLLLTMTPYYSFIDQLSDRAKLMNLDDLLDQTKSSDRNRRAVQSLKRALGYLDMAIIQQNAIHGDIFVPMKPKGRRSHRPPSW